MTSPTSNCFRDNLFEFSIFKFKKSMIVTLIFLVQGHDMTVVEVNGSYV